jgi:hypothetical protein
MPKEYNRWLESKHTLKISKPTTVGVNGSVLNSFSVDYISTISVTISKIVIRSGVRFHHILRESTIKMIMKYISALYSVSFV